MIADFKCSGGKQEGVGLATYMLDPEAKNLSKNDPHIKKHFNKENSERILLVATDHCLPVMKGVAPSKSAQTFLSAVEKWNKKHRVGQKQPKAMWEQIVVAFSPEDNGKISPSKAIEIAREALHEVAPGKRPTLFAVHGDTHHLHVHMMYATVNHQHKIHNKHGDFRLWEAAMERLEKKHNLFRVEKRIACSHDDLSRLPDGTRPSKHEYRMTQRTGQPSGKQKLRSLIDDAILSARAAPDSEKFTKFMQSLQSNKIEVRANIQSNGNILGLRFYHGIFSNHGIKSSALGKTYCWAQLSKSTGYGHNQLLNTEYLKLSDHRIGQWIRSSSGQQWAMLSVQKDNIGKCNSVNAPTKSTKSSLSSASSGSIITAIAEFPADYPDWLKDYLRALAAGINAEAAMQRKADKKLHISIQKLLDMLVAAHTRNIDDRTKNKKPDQVDTKSNNWLTTQLLSTK